MNRTTTKDFDPTSTQFKGVWPALLTPLNASGEPNLKALKKLTELMISQGSDGLYILGSTGQGFLLSESQRKTVAEVVISTNSDSVPIIVQVGSMTTRESVTLAEHAAVHGAHGISSVGPVYYSAPDGSSQMALEHYSAIATATDLPFFPYQFGNGSYPEGVEGFVSALMKIPNVTGMKLTTSNLLQIGAIHNHSSGRLALFSGADELLCHAALCGTSGAIGTTYNLWGQECQRVRKEFVNGNVELGISFMLVFQQVIDTILPNAWTFFQQAMQYRYGIDIGKTIAPLGNTNQPWPEKDVIQIVNQVINAANQ
jgi:N-acetylneuraminate lyase